MQNGNHVTGSLNKLRGKICSSSKSKFITYIDLNPSLGVHNVYKDSSANIPELYRISFSRFRLSSHRLRIETGRWARLPREQRLCTCSNNAIQDEQHVIENCHLVQHIRVAYPKPALITDVLNKYNDVAAFKFVDDMLTFYE